ncbi:metal-dependent hydrolase family protein [Sphingomicrobium clamense]|uniref:Amidohydrolase family protein n=1 Tax=Sphingomicrobium clamense TaxID=2851013 RepID=A0ABS6V7C7_9SPHN|nr:amidohydrolase family protein [Sphingomicrobium sp. B8]MBW0145428.1 amidohydrolase family protein [Sphingomicrobium sp. B8]
MKRLMLAATAMLAAATPAAAQDTILVGNLIADAREGGTGPATITVNQGRIVAVEPGHQRPPSGEVVDLSDKTVMPGLIDLHTHLSGDPSGDYWRAATTPVEWNTVLAVKNARKTLEAGFTTVRNPGSDQHSAHMLRRATEQWVVPGPRIWSAGPALAIIGGHGDTNGFRPEINELLDSGYNCTGPTECAAKVRLASQNGADFIKITATGGVLSQQGRGLEAHFTDAEMKSIVDTAATLGIHVAAHAHGARGIEAASNAGVRTIEHGTYLDREAARAMKANGTVLVPTLMAFKGIEEGLAKNMYTPVVVPKVRATVALTGEQVRMALAEGVTVAFGTDSGVFEHGRNGEEFQMLVDAGMNPTQALVSATITAAEVLDMGNEIGRIAPGMSADLIAFDGDPYQDVTVLEEVDWVMVRGRTLE